MANFISHIIFAYLIIYSIYFLTFVIKSFQAKRFLKIQENKLILNEAQNKLCVIIWASEKNKNLYKLLEVLNNQTYSKSNYEVHVMYKNTSKMKTTVPDFAHGARIHNIENPEYAGKDRAITMFLEKIITESKFDAFVFLGAERLVSSNYLEIINRAYEPSCVMTGSLEIIPNSTTIFKKLFSYSLKVKNTLTNSTVFLPRSMFELCQTIDSENCVISADIVEQTGRVCFETRNDELKYSLFLASNSIKPIYNHFIKTGVEAEKYNSIVPSLRQAWELLKYYSPHLFKKKRYFTEFLISVFRPTTLFILLTYLTLFYFAFTFKTSIDIKYVFHFGLLLLSIMFASIISAKLTFKEVLYLFLSPIPLLVSKAVIISRKLSQLLIKTQNEIERNTNSATVRSIISNGKKDTGCKLDIITEEGMRKVVFRYNKRQLSSDTHLRMCDALNEVVQILGERGFILKVCQNCKFYSVNNDGTVDLLKGYCNMAGDPEVKEDILIWNSCRNFTPKNEDFNQ